MLICLDEVGVGGVYKFKYNGKTRVVVPSHEIDQDLLCCWDFTIMKYRTFDMTTVCSRIEDVTSDCILTQDVNTTFSDGVLTKEINGMLYAVNLKWQPSDSP